MATLRGLANNRVSEVAGDPAYGHVTTHTSEVVQSDQAAQQRGTRYQGAFLMLDRDHKSAGSGGYAVEADPGANPCK